MAKRNAYLDKQKAAKENFMQMVEHIVRQYDIDTLCIAINRCGGYGYDRIMELMDVWHEVRVEYKDAINPHVSVEADVAQEHMDRELARIMRGKAPLIPFEERQPFVRKIKY